MNTIDEGKKFYPLFNENHLKRNLKFHPEKHNDMITLAAFPRSGSSLMLNIIENVTGYFCGEDMDIETSHEAVSKGNVRATIEYVKIFRSHYPWLAKYPFRIRDNIPCKRAVVLIRNPFRSIVSLFALMTSKSHTTNLPREEYERRSEDFDLFLRICADAYAHFCDFWTKQSIPVLFVKYEDLMREPVDTCQRMFKFMGYDDLDGKVVEYFETNGLRSTLNSKQKSKDDQYSYFTCEQTKYIYETNKYWFSLLGYNEELRENIGEIVEDVEVDRKLLERTGGSGTLVMTHNNGEFEKQCVDPLIPISFPTRFPNGC